MDNNGANGFQMIKKKEKRKKKRKKKKKNIHIMCRSGMGDNNRVDYVQNYHIAVEDEGNYSFLFEQG